VLLLGLIVSLPATGQTTAPNQWTWIGGTSTGIGGPVYGTQGTPDAANTPGDRFQAAAWTDSGSHFWLFGGVSGEGPYERFNDLWRYDSSTGEWTWIGGQTSPNAPSVYGTLGTPSAANFPGARDGAVAWTDHNGNLWLFGGEEDDGGGNFSVLNDTWEFNPTTKLWTWVAGSSTTTGNCFADNQIQNCAAPGTYGTRATFAAGNAPPGRKSASVWTDSGGNLWLTGGWGYDVPNKTQYFYNDLWEFDPSRGQWRWMGGSSTTAGSYCVSNSNFDYPWCGQAGIYGTLGTAASINGPGGRTAPNTWTDKGGNLWLFGGEGFDTNGGFSDLNDVWKFDPATDEWVWMGGSSVIPGYYDTQTGVYGTVGTPSPDNIPAVRWNSVSWTDGSGNLWLFGGLRTWASAQMFMDDLWRFDPSANLWTWMGGNSWPLSGEAGVYGVLGTPAAGNNPGSRFGATAWTDSSRNFWIYGGQFGSNVQGNSLYANDLWEYQPSSAPLPKTATPVFSVSGGSYSSAQTVTLSSATNGAKIYYTTDGSTPTTSSLQFFANLPISVPYSETLKAIAIASGCLDSDVTTATYILATHVATPTFSLPAGTYNTAQSVIISSATSGVNIYYTTDGSSPSLSSPGFAGSTTPPITISATETLKAIAVASGYGIPSGGASDVATAVYVINLPQAATPTFSVPAGTYASAQTVAISDSTSGVTIYYTIDGDTPTTNSTVYSSPITVASSETLKAFATASGYSASAVASADYTINPPSFSITGTSVSVSPGAATGNTSTITLTPSGGFTGAISLSCAITPKAASDPATCSVPASVAITGSAAQTVTLTVNTTAATSAVRKPGGLFRTSAGGIFFACVLLVFLPSRLRRWRTMVGTLLLVFSVIGGALGCGGSGNGGGGTGGGGNPGTSPGNYTITITGTAGGVTQTGTVSLTVQ
jgi:N-acetylneuraminic acid mutarotase